MTAEQAEAAWKHLHDELHAFGRDLGTEYDDAPLVLDALEKTTRAFANETGCIVEESKDPGGVKLKCPPLSADADARKQKLEGATRTHAPTVLAAAKTFVDGCQAAGLATFEHALRWAAVGGSKATSTEPSKAAGCSHHQFEACEKSCRGGLADACTTFVVGASSDPKEKMRRGIVVCEIAREGKIGSADKACGLAVDVCYGSGADVASCGKLFDTICAVVPSASNCTSVGLDPGKPWFDEGRANRAYDAIAACTGPTCNKASLMFLKPPFDSKERTTAAMDWIEQKCSGGDEACAPNAFFVLTPRAGTIDKPRASRVADSLEKLCTPRDTKGCSALWMARQASGPAPKPARAFEIAELTCRANEVECSLLAACYRAGICGKPKDPKLALEADTKSCAAFMQQNPTAQRALLPQCKAVDGAKKH